MKKEHSDFISCLVLSDQHSKTKQHSVYYNVK